MSSLHILTEDELAQLVASANAEKLRKVYRELAEHYGTQREQLARLSRLASSMLLCAEPVKLIGPCSCNLVGCSICTDDGPNY